MFVQNDLYPADEYGTRDCREWREPCGAFYGLTNSGEIEEQPLYVRDQIYAFMPDRTPYATHADEQRMAEMGTRKDETLDIDKEIENLFRHQADTKDGRRERMVHQFCAYCYPCYDEQREFTRLVDEYLKHETPLLLNDVLRYYENHIK